MAPTSTTTRQHELSNRSILSMEKALPLRKHRLTPPPSDREQRTSFASFKEDRSSIAQSFIDSKTSSYARYDEEAIDDLSSGAATPLETESQLAVHFPTSKKTAATLAEPTMLWTHPDSMLHGYVCPCSGFRGWKQISVKGKAASRSFSDLRVLSKGFSWEVIPVKANGRPVKFAAGLSPFERLPNELLASIIDLLVTDIPPNGCQPRNVDLMSLLLTSRAIHSATLATLYNQVTIPHSSVFRKFLDHIAEYPSLGTIVRRLDFSHFNPTGAGMTRRERNETQNLTPTTLVQCLELLPSLREFLAQEHIDEDLGPDVLRKLFKLPRLQALDFCASSSAPFRDSMMAAVRSFYTPDFPQYLTVTRLSFHECTILPSAVFESLMPRLPKLTHLDVTHTRITDIALTSIPKTAKITHLNLSKCSSLSGEVVVEFLRSHPAVNQSLVYLNLLMDAKSAEMLSAFDVTALLPTLPRTLRSLNLKGSKMTANHLPLLLPLTKHLEELGLGRGLSYEEASTLIHPPSSQDEEPEQWTPHTLRYIDISDLEPAQIDLGLLFSQSQSILKTATAPLEVIEVSQSVYDRLKDKDHVLKQFGWVIKEAGRRGWLVRDLSIGRKAGDMDAKIVDDGSRSWKMGATYWGMRKVPVARAEVGGMYGLYMFKR